MATSQVLARKWRPRLFTELVGQDHVVRALGNALQSGRLHHAYYRYPLWHLRCVCRN